MEMQRGFRDKLNKYIDTSQSLSISVSVSGTRVYSCSCLYVDDNGRCSHSEQQASAFSVNLSSLPPNIARLVFTVSVDEPGTMGEVSSLVLSVNDSLTLSLTGQDFSTEKAIICAEIYRKDSEWRISATASGFNGGMSELLRQYGVQERQKVSLEKKLENGAPKLVSLAKPLVVELRKRSLQEITARVALVLDISGSMSKRYANGTVQEIVNKTLPLAVQFDDDGELDFWYYGTTCKRMQSVNMSNYERAVPEDWRRLMREIGGQTNAAEVIREVIAEYSGSRVPAYVLFITDGGFNSESAVKKLIVEASRQAIFWQFVGVGGKLGGRGYGILERLDTMTGRFIDNANFFMLDDFMTVGSSEIYSRLLDEFPKWLNEARQKGLI